MKHASAGLKQKMKAGVLVIILIAMCFFSKTLFSGVQFLSRYFSTLCLMCFAFHLSNKNDLEATPLTMAAPGSFEHSTDMNESSPPPYEVYGNGDLQAHQYGQILRVVREILSKIEKIRYGRSCSILEFESTNKSLVYTRFCATSSKPKYCRR